MVKPLKPSPPTDNPALPREPTILSPVMVVTMGTSGVEQLRHFHASLTRRFGKKPDHVILRALDSTHQHRSDDVEMLPDESFYDLVNQPQIQDRIRQAWEDPHVRIWMPRLVTELPLGNGVGGMEPGTRFLYEQSVPKLSLWMGKLTECLTAAKRPLLAELASRNPVLRALNAAVSASGPIRVIYVASATGGTVGAMFYDVFYLRHHFRAKGIEANFSLFLTPPAVTPTKDVEAVRKLRKFLARIQESVDLVNGKPFCWEMEGLTVEDFGLPFESLYILPEPSPGGLTDHHRKVGELLMHLVSPLGKTLCDQSVNMLGLYRERGPRGQRKFLSLLNMSTIHATAVDEPVRFAEVIMGTMLTESAPLDLKAEASELLETVGLTTSLTDAAGVKVSRPTVPDDLGDEGPFLKHAERTARAEGRQKGQEQLAVAEQFLTTARTQVQAKAKELTISAGPAAAANFVRAIGALLVEHRRAAVTRHANYARRSEEAPPSSIKARLDAVLVEQGRAARAEYLVELTKKLQSPVEHAEHLHDRLQAASEVLENVRVESEQKRLDFDLTRPKEHAFLDRPALEEIARAAGADCRRQVRQLAAEMFQGPGFDPSRFEAAVRVLLAQAAQPFARLANIDEAMRAAGERGRLALQNAVQAAEPAVRLDPTWDPNKHSARFVLMTVPETHPAAAAAGATGRQMFASGSWTTSSAITFVGVDFGVEPAALVATTEALEASILSPSEIPPYADQRYEPLADIMVPPEVEWFAYLAIPIHLQLQTGVIRCDELRAWTYEGKEVGQNRKLASAALRRRHNRAPFLPSFEELTAETQELLLSVGDGHKVVEVLAAIEEKVTSEMADADPGTRLVLTFERAAARALLTCYRARIRQAAAHRNIWRPSGNGAVDGKPVHPEGPPRYLGGATHGDVTNE